MNNFKIYKCDFCNLLEMATRYALGHCSTAPSQIESIVEQYAECLDEETCIIMFRDINEALARGRAGIQCNMETWHRVRKIVAEQYKKILREG